MSTGDKTWFVKQKNRVEIRHFLENKLLKGCCCSCCCFFTFVLRHRHPNVFSCGPLTCHPSMHTYKIKFLCKRSNFRTMTALTFTCNERLTSEACCFVVGSVGKQKLKEKKYIYLFWKTVDETCRVTNCVWPGLIWCVCSFRLGGIKMYETVLCIYGRVCMCVCVCT